MSADSPRDESSNENESPGDRLPSPADESPLAENYRPVLPAEDDAADVYSFANPPASWSEVPVVQKVERRVPDETPSKRANGTGAWFLMYCNLLVFATSISVMVLELTASRLIARHIGSSLYTWTSVIGVVLSGITVGNYLGGWLADRFDPRRLLPILFLAASILAFSVLWVDQLAAGQERPADWAWSSWVLLIVAECYFLPSLALGTISPVVAMLALSRARKRGQALGNVYAWGAFGSIVGTFLAGFVLIDAFGTRAIVALVALSLAGLSALSAGQRLAWKIAVVAGWMQSMGLVSLLAIATESQGAVWCYQLSAGLSGEHLVDQLQALDANAQRTVLQRIDSQWGHFFDADVHGQLAIVAENGSSEGLSELIADSLAQLEPQDHVQIVRWYDVPVPEGRNQRWARFGASLGAHLHELGLLIGLRDDLPDEYHDESLYSYINVARDDSIGDDVLALRLDKLIHSYYSPYEPDSLYYEYEEIYAAVTELAMAQTSEQQLINLRETGTSPAQWQPDSESGQASLPDWLELDASENQLRISGQMTESRRHQLLERMPGHDYWRVLNELRLVSQADRWQGYAAFDLAELPAGTEWPEELSRQIAYDVRLQKIVAYEPLSEALFERLIDAGPDAAYYRTVHRLGATTVAPRTLFLGGGGFVFPRWIESRFPAARAIDVAEIDPDVVRAVRREMGLLHPTRTRVQPRIGDARAVVDELLREPDSEGAGRKYDLIYADAFNDFSVPWHLTTREFAQRIDRLLAENGVYLVNLIDIYPRTVFEHDGQQPVEVEYVGALPAAWRDLLSVNRWEPVGATDRFQILRISEGKYRMRIAGYLEDTLLEKLKAEAPIVTVETALEQLQRLSQSARTLESLPESWCDPFAIETGWRKLDRFPGIEIRRADLAADAQPTWMLAVRGRMSPELRESLVAECAEFPEALAAIEQLDRRSRQETVGRFLGRYVRTVSEVFPSVYVFSSTQGVPSGDRDTFVIVCARRQLDFTGIQRTGLWSVGPFAWTETRDGQSAAAVDNQWSALIGLSDGMSLTDDYAPVENLLAPVFTRQD